MSKKYDAIIIGAGMSGLAAGIRLAMFDKKVCILEKHSISGGLNSYYQRGKHQLDVGLHAMTNFIEKGERGKPLSKLLKQLRIPYDQLELIPQKQSQIWFPETKLHFNNDFELLRSEVAENFPNQIDGFNKLVEEINAYNEVALDNPFYLAKEVVRKFITDENLLEMLFAPLLIYGSAWENDMDFSQFVIMFKSIYLEGFSRPRGGVRTIIDLLLEKFEKLGGELHFKTQVAEVLSHNGETSGLITTDGQLWETSQIISSIGLPETQSLLESPKNESRIGKMSFTESIALFDSIPKSDNTIIFYNNTPKYAYRCPDELIDKQSAVVCLPNNFKENDNQNGIIRVTHIANSQKWFALERKQYKDQKKLVFDEALQLSKKLLPDFSGEVIFNDVFSPTTIKRYTGHLGGCVYGSPDKARDGRTGIKGLNICGTDQGFLGIVGAMLSGISIANLYGLMEST